MDTDYLKDLFDKEITCPVCNSTFNQKVVKVNSPRIISKDSDFFLRYKAINPYFYDVWMCNSCGYTAMKNGFEKIREKQKNSILENITRKWTPKHHPPLLTLDHAIERYKLSLITANIANMRESTYAILTLKIAWMYRLKEDSKNETFFLEKSLKCFLNAFMNEPFPIFGLQRDELSYLIAELFRRTNNVNDALLWYSKVVTSTNASPKVKELARTARYQIKDSLKES